jgi:hypothetical protein
MLAGIYTVANEVVWDGTASLEDNLWPHSAMCACKKEDVQNKHKSKS